MNLLTENEIREAFSGARFTASTMIETDYAIAAGFEELSERVEESIKQHILKDAIKAKAISIRGRNSARTSGQYVTLVGSCYIFSEESFKELMKKLADTNFVHL